MIESNPQHGSRRRLAVRPGDGNALRRIEERRIDVGAMKTADAKARSLDDFGVVFGNGAGDNDSLGAPDVLRAVPLVYGRAKFPKLLGQRRRAEIRAGHPAALCEQDMRQCAHARPADADKMYLMDVFQQQIPLLLLSVRFLRPVSFYRFASPSTMSAISSAA